MSIKKLAVKAVTLTSEGRVNAQYTPKTITSDTRDLGGHVVKSMAEIANGIAIEAGPHKVLIPWSNISTVEYA